MALGPIEMNGMISRTQDVTTIKQNIDNKGMVDQANIKNVVNEEIDQAMHQVHDADDSRNSEGEFDARREGRNKYMKTSTKKKGKPKTEGRVVVKDNKGFDIKI
ncbi:MAG: hypothetical protein E7241_04190 [Lachnospiraceae bacterium]|jgi:hypothetical protein|nr:hypothetical protein [Lachnospiraceae bacterium]